MSNIFGGNTGLSYEQAKRLRERALAMRGGQQRPRTIGQGLSALGEGLASGLMERRANKKIGESKEKATSVFQGLFGGGGQSRGTDFNPGASQPSSGMFGQKEQEYGLPSGYLARTAQIESSNDPNAQNPNSSAGGLFQFIDSTAKQYGLTDKTDPVASTDAAARLAADNAAVLRQRLGRDPSPAELYLAHQQGAGGAVALLSNPDAPAVSVVGRDAVRLNGGDENMTAGQFAGLWTGKFGGQGRASTRNPGQGTQVAGGGSTVQQLMQAAATPGMSEQQKSIIGMMLQQRLQQQDPMRQMQMERAQLELEQMRNPQPDLTGTQKEYEQARRQGFQGTLLDYRRALAEAGRDQTTINNNMGAEAGQYLYGSDAGLPNGWRLDRETGQATRIPGGPAAVEQQTLDEKSQERDRQQRIGMGTTLTNLQMNIDEIKDGGIPVTGPIGSVSGMIPGTDASDWRVRNEQITTEGALAEIQNMRDNSPTGGAVGQLTDSERQAIALAATGLSSAQSRDEYIRAAENYRKVMLDTAFGSGKWDLSDEGEIILSVEGQPQGGSMDFSNMGVAEVGQVDIMSLTDEQMDALERRMQELGL